MKLEKSHTMMTGSEFYKEAATMNWKERDSFALKSIQRGNIPSFLKKFVSVKTSIVNEKGKTITALLYVSLDYISLGSDSDWARIPLTPKTAQKIADQFNCFLPTRKLVNDIYQVATVKLEPIPLTNDRDSSATMWLHHKMIEKERNGRNGLIVGIKKDIVISSKLFSYSKNDRVAIYGWHKLDGNPIQPLYTGHVDWYVDYSHGVRLIVRKIKISPRQKGFKRWMDYIEVLKHPILKKLLCDEEDCSFYHY